MDERDLLADQFEAHRAHLRSVAYRMLGSGSDADDAVQEAWIRLSRSDAGAIDNLGGWLTTVVARVCLDQLRSRGARPEAALAGAAPDDRMADELAVDPEHDAVLGDSIGIAMLVVLEALTPPERVAFVLHDLFAVPFDEIAPIVGRSTDATRQLASRARRRVQGADPAHAPDPVRRREIVDAFLAAARGGDLTALVALLDPDVVLRADAAAVRTGADPEVTGAGAVAETFAGRAKAAQTALVDGAAQLVWAMRGDPKVVFAFTIADDLITAIDLLADPEQLGRLEIELLDN